MASPAASVPQVVLPLFSFDQAVDFIARSGSQRATASDCRAAKEQSPIFQPPYARSWTILPSLSPSHAQVAAGDLSRCLPILEELAAERSKGSSGDD